MNLYPAFTARQVADAFGVSSRCVRKARQGHAPSIANLKDQTIGDKLSRKIPLADKTPQEIAKLGYPK